MVERKEKKNCSLNSAQLALISLFFFFPSPLPARPSPFTRTKETRPP